MRSLVATAVCILAAVLLTGQLHAAGRGRTGLRETYCVVTFPTDSSTPECRFGVMNCEEAFDRPDTEIVGSPLPTRDKAEEMRDAVTRFCEDAREVMLDEDGDDAGEAEGEETSPDEDSPADIECYLLVDPHPFEPICDLQVVACEDTIDDLDGAVVAGPFTSAEAAGQAAETFSAACRDHLDQTSSIESPGPDIYVWMSRVESLCEFSVLSDDDAGHRQDLVAVAGPFHDPDSASDVAEAASIACRAWRTGRELDPCSGDAVPQCTFLRV